MDTTFGLRFVRFLKAQSFADPDTSAGINFIAFVLYLYFGTNIGNNR